MSDGITDMHREEEKQAVDSDEKFILEMILDAANEAIRGN